MKVSELIIELQKLNQDKEIVYMDDIGLLKINKVVPSELYGYDKYDCLIIDGDEYLK